MADMENEEREERLWEAKKAEYERVRNLDAEVKTLRAENERLLALVRNAYNEGFTEGMKEHTTNRGGNPWPMSKSRSALERKPE